MNTLFRCSLVVLTTFWLAGCGLKGPLYMPSDEPPKKESPLKAEQPKPEQTENNTQVGNASAK
ncbi:LPS translocon maturation chaperone LptM [Pragia fontium]|nr:lipoprotein [Pragia fontium]GKX64514.1 hypothetical protein SOASR032_30830 [Pragia fontium]